jgi:uncharacterized cupredoxin-like copper-binding protein
VREQAINGNPVNLNRANRSHGHIAWTSAWLLATGDAGIDDPRTAARKTCSPPDGTFKMITRFLAPCALWALACAAPLCSAHGSHDSADAQPAKQEQTDWGIAGDPARATRTVAIDMLDTMRYSPATLSVRRGETVRLVVTNKGAVMHELVIGTQKSLAQHAAMMAKSPDMVHAEPYIAHVKPGATGEIVWTFNRAGTFEFACLVPGHLEAGMRGTLEVVVAKS